MRYFSGLGERAALSGLCVLFVCFSVTYSILMPFFEAPDAGAHFKYVVYLHRHLQLPALAIEEASFSHQLVQQPPLYYGLVWLLTSPAAVEFANDLDVANPYYSMGLSHRATISTHSDFWQATVPIWTARAISLVGGLLTLIGTFALTRRLLHNGRASLAVSSVVALNPQFLFGSATISNDTWTAALVVLALWLAVRNHQSGARVEAWIGVGLLAGAAGLAKYSGLVVIFPLGVLLVWVARHYGTRDLLWVVFYVALGSALVAGYWYGRNLILWGTPVPTEAMLALLPALRRPEPLDLSLLLSQARWVLRSYWGVFGYGLLAQPGFYAVTGLLTNLAVLGWLVWVVRLAARRWGVYVPGALLLAASIALVWFGASLIAFLNWMRLVQFTDQGRLLFPAAPAIALLLVLGWAAWVPGRAQNWMMTVIPFVFTGLALSQVPTLHAGFQQPQPIVEPMPFARVVQAEFEGGMQLVGLDLPEGGAVDANGTLPVVLYWTAERPIDDFFTLFVHLADEQDRLIAQFDGVPFGGRHATRQWKQGEVFADPYRLAVGDLDDDGLAELSLGFYRFDTPGDRVFHLDDHGSLVADRVVLAPIRLHAGEGTPKLPAAQVQARWLNGIELAAANLDVDDDGAPAALELVWTTDSVIHQDFTVFVQVLSANDTVLAQDDRRPNSGRFPTSTWRPGDRIADVYTFERDAVVDWRKVIVGLYVPESGMRLPLDAPHAPADALEIAIRGGR